MSEKVQRTAEIAELGELALREAATATAGIAAIHAAIARRAFGAVRRGVGPAAAPPRLMHDAIAAGTYATIVGAFSGAAAAVSAVARLVPDVDGLAATPRSGTDAVAPSHTPDGAQAIAVLQGLIGDHLEDTTRTLAFPMAARIDGRAVPITAAALARIFPSATDHVVVFIHGLMETEAAWEFGDGPTYGQQLDAQLGTTSLFLRYNTGRRVAANGMDLSAMLDELVTTWPVPLRRITLVGHSMGGLVARSAAHHASAADRAWLRLLGDIVTLGTPHLGAPLARAVHKLSAMLALAPETRPFSRLLTRRSAGVRDLVHGSITHDDGHPRDKDDFDLGDAVDIPVPRHVRLHHAAAVMTDDPRHLVGLLLGDGLVQRASARGRDGGRDIGLSPHTGIALGGAHHFTLLGDDRVAAWLLAALSGPRAHRQLH